MAVFLWVPLVVPVALALLLAATRGPALVRYAAMGTSLTVLVSGLALVTAVLHESVPVSASGLLRADALSAYMLTVVGAVGLTATWGSLQHTGSQEPDPHAATYAALVCLFLAAMSLAVLADNLGVMWVAVEATTIATAFLVGHHRTRRALEAAWKYVILGSVGVAIAFLGIVLLYAASRGAGEPTLSWSLLTTSRLPMDPALLRLASALAVLGFATKAGLAPMHSWLPDAHSQAPAPVSGLMSGVLLSVAFYAILRIQAIADHVLGPGPMRWLLGTAALLSLTAAALLLLRQRDYKRMLAYSSIEHMGLLALGAAAGGVLGISAALLHMLGHGLTKSSLFVVSGRMLETEGTTTIADVRALLARRPGLAVPWLAGMVALLGFPPFSLFFSEVGIVVAGWSAGLTVLTGAALALLLVVTAALFRLTGLLTLGRSEGDGAEPHSPDRSAHGPRTPLLLALGATAVVGFLAVPVGSLLVRAATVLVQAAS